MGVLVWHLYTYGSLTWHRGYDTYSLGCYAHGNVISKVPNLRNLGAFNRHYLIKGDGRANGCLYILNKYVVALESLYNAVLVLFLLICVNRHHLAVILKQIVCWKFVVGQFKCGVILAVLLHKAHAGVLLNHL